MFNIENFRTSLCGAILTPLQHLPNKWFFLRKLAGRISPKHLLVTSLRRAILCGFMWILDVFYVDLWWFMNWCLKKLREPSEFPFTPKIQARPKCRIPRSKIQSPGPCFWLHGGLGALIICTSLSFVHVSTLMLCNIKMSLMLDSLFMVWGVFWGGEGGGLAVITFLIVRSWWFMCMKLYTMIYVFLMKWHMCCYAVHSSWYMSWYFAATLYAFAVSSSYFMYVKWHKCWYAFHSWAFIYFACFGYKRTWWRLY